jgi:hypothetical protein
MVERNAEVSPDRRNKSRLGIHIRDVAEESDGMRPHGQRLQIAAQLWPDPLSSVMRGV